MKEFCKSLKEQAKSIIDFENKKMLGLTRKELKSHREANGCYIFEIRFFKKSSNYVNHQCHYTGKYMGVAHSICNLKFNVSNEIPVVFHNGSKYVFHFIIKEFTNDFDGKFECIGENSEK